MIHRCLMVMCVRDRSQVERGMKERDHRIETCYDMNLMCLYSIGFGVRVRSAFTFTIENAVNALSGTTFQNKQSSLKFFFFFNLIFKFRFMILQINIYLILNKVPPSAQTCVLLLLIFIFVAFIDKSLQIKPLQQIWRPEPQNECKEF